MAPLTLTAVSRTTGANRALKAGDVPVEGVDLAWEEVNPLIKAFRRMVRENAWDVCEMALTTYVCAKEHGARFTALPVFLVRAFHHGAILINEAAGVRAGKDLEGRRVGVNRGFTVTTGVWARGVLEEEHGVDLSKVEWVLSGDEHVATWRRPANVTPVPEGRDVAEMLKAGELAGAVGVEAEGPGLRPLVADPEAAGLRALRERNVWPINHLVVVRDEVLAANPGLGPRLFEAFAESKRRYVEALRAGPLAGGETAADRAMRAVMAEIGDPLPYGVASNQATLEALAGHALRQGIVTKPVDVDALFDPATLPLTG